MKLENIKVDEWVFDKDEKMLVCVSHIDIDGMIYARGNFLNLVNCPPSQFRKPRISDLSVGDVFEVFGRTLKLNLIDASDRACASDIKSGENFRFRTIGLPKDYKVRIISLAAENHIPSPHAASPAQNQTSNI